MGFGTFFLLYPLLIQKYAYLTKSFAFLHLLNSSQGTEHGFVIQTMTARRPLPLPNQSHDRVIMNCLTRPSMNVFMIKFYLLIRFCYWLSQHPSNFMRSQFFHYTRYSVIKIKISHALYGLKQKFPINIE